MTEVPLQPSIAPDDSPRLLRLRDAALPVLLLSLAVWLVYVHTAANGLIFDDRDTILHNQAIVSLDNLGMLVSRADYFGQFGEYSYRPVVTLSYFVDHALGGDRAWVFHVHNVAIHHLNVVLAFALFVLLGAGRWRAFFVALIFGLHPLASEAVIFPGFREDLQMTAGVLAMSVFMALDRERPGFVWLIGAAIAYAYGLLAKEAALLLPAAWLAVDWILNRYSLERARFIRRYALLVVVCAGYVLVRFYLMTNPGASEMGIVELKPMAQRALTVPVLFGKYLWRFVWPPPLCVLSDFEPVEEIGRAFYVATTAVALFVAIWVGLSVRRPWLWLAGFWIGATFAPVSNLYPIINLWAERFYYSINLGTAAIAVAAIGGVWDFAARRLDPPVRRKAVVAGWTIAGGLIFLAMLCDNIRVMECRNSLTLWRATYRVLPDNGIAVRNLARAELNAGNFTKAEKLALEAEPLEGGGTWAANYIIGRSAYLQKDWPRAILYYEKALSVPAPSDALQAGLYRSIGDAYLRNGDKEKAIQHIRAALEWDPENPTARKLLRQLGVDEDAPTTPTD